jgi:hypothetical protein
MSTAEGNQASERAFFGPLLTTPLIATSYWIVERKRLRIFNKHWVFFQYHKIVAIETL